MAFDRRYLWHSLGTVLLQQRQLSQSLSAFQEGLARRPCSSQLLLGAAIVHGQMGHFEDGRQYFLRAVQADPSHAHAWQAWGVMEARLVLEPPSTELPRPSTELPRPSTELPLTCH